MSSKVIELQEQLDVVSTPEQRADVLYTLAWEIRNQDIRKTLQLSEECLQLSETSSYTVGIAYSLRNIAFVYQQLARYDESCKKAYRALDLFESLGDQKGEASVLNTLGINYYRLGDYENSILVHQKALNKREEVQDLQGVGASYINLGNVYSGLKDYNNSLRYFNRGLEIVTDPFAKAAIINNIGTVNILKKDFAEAEKLFNESIRIKIDISDDRGLAVSYSNLADCYLNLGNYKEAEEYQLLSLKLHQQTVNPSGEALCFLGLGKVYKETGQFNEAVKVLEKALQIYDDLQLRDDQIDVFDTLAAVYQKTGDFKKAFEHQQNLNEVLKKVSEEETQKKIGNMQLLHQLETVRHEAEIHRLKNVELRKLNEEIEEKNKEITDSINYAQLIQKAMLPDVSEIAKSFSDAFVFFQPRNIVSGDFYWFHRMDQRDPDSPCIIVVADCTGHGVPGAFMSMIGNTVLNQLVIEKNVTDPGSLLTQLDEKVRVMLKQYQHGSGSRDGMDVAAIYFEPAHSRLKYAGANRPMLVLSDAQINEFEPDKFPIGGFQGIEKSFTTTEVSLKAGDLIYLFTDGLVDQFGGLDEKARGTGGKKLMAKRFFRMIYDYSAKPLSEQHLQFSTLFNTWKGELEQTDDVCLLAIRI